MQYAIVVLGLSMFDDINNKKRLESSVKELADAVRSIGGGEVLAENFFLIPLHADNGLPVLLTVLRRATELNLKCKTAFLTEKPLFAVS